MRYIKLELAGYKRFKLNNIDRLVIEPNEKIQLILGTNGSGKSSLVREFTPLPASPTDYRKDGYKIITIMYNGHLYIAKSVFDPKPTHSLLKDGIELNPGGTITVQKELIREEFGITPDIHELLLGNTTFTSMSSSDRRKWFTLFSSADYTYAIRVYQKLKERHRDISGAIKLNQTRSVQEANKLLTPTEESRLRSEITYLSQYIDHLLALRPTVNTTLSQLNQELDSNEDEIKRHIHEYRRLRRLFRNVENYPSVDAIDSDIIGIRDRISRLDHEKISLTRDIESAQNTHSMLLKSNVNDISEIDTKIIDLTNEIFQHNSVIKIPLQYTDARLALQSLDSVYSTLVDVFTALEPNRNREYSRDKYNQLRDIQTSLQSDITILSKRQDTLLALKAEQEHFKSHGTIECPECRNKWIINYDPVKYSMILKELDSISVRLADKNKHLDETISSMEAIKLYMTHYKVYADITRTLIILQPIWDYIQSTELLFNDPRKLIALLNDIRMDLDIYVKISHLNMELDDLNRLREMIQNDGSAHVSNIEKQLSELESRLYHVNSTLIESNSRLNRVNMYKDTALRIDETIKKLEQSATRRDTLGEQYIDVLRRDTINAMIKTIELYLIDKEQQLSRIDIQKALVNDINEQLNQLTLEESVLRVMVKELSPTDGLIAKGLTGFINLFVKQMNAFISQVWLYPLEIIPIIPTDIDAIDLDYKFAVSINNDHVIPDISKGSSAMKEIIDLAYKVTAMKYLGLSDHPLILDEFAARLDYEHRINAFKIINDVIAYGTHSQIFLISHYSDCYGSLKNTEVIVMCSNNIELPRDTIYNRHVVIE